MKNNKPGKNKVNTSFFKKSYYITLENTGKRTVGAGVRKLELIDMAQYSYYEESPS